MERTHCYCGRKLPKRLPPTSNWGVWQCSCGLRKYCQDDYCGAPLDMNDECTTYIDFLESEQREERGLI